MAMNLLYMEDLRESWRVFKEMYCDSRARARRWLLGKNGAPRVKRAPRKIQASKQSYSTLSYHTARITPHVSRSSKLKPTDPSDDHERARSCKPSKGQRAPRTPSTSYSLLLARGGDLLPLEQHGGQLPLDTLGGLGPVRSDEVVDLWALGWSVKGLR